MKWFKHDTDARNSLKLRKVRRKYGADGYAIYWFCLEAIAYEVDKDNLTFDLKEDAETIAFELSIQEKRVEEIMVYLVETDLFESSQGIITCLKLAKRLDKSMTNSPKMRAWLDGKNVMMCADDVTIQPDDVSTSAELDQIRLDQTRSEESKDKPKLLILKDGSDFELTKPQIDKWIVLYPGLDINTQVNKMIGWCDANPSKRKTRRGILKFMNGWLSRAQDSAKTEKDPMQASADSDWHKEYLGI